MLFTTSIQILFCHLNLYMNILIGKLNNTKVGYLVDGTWINNVSYADDMVFLRPSISASRKLISVCEKYAEAHDLHYKKKWIVKC